MPALVNHVRNLQAGRRGITLIELLVVMVILSIVTAASIPLLTTGVEQRRVRESARLVASYISSSKARAIETGRPAGVMIQRYLPGSLANTSGVLQSLPDYAFTLVTVEVPPPYSGDTTSSMAQISSQYFQSVVYGGVSYGTISCGVISNLGYGGLNGGTPPFFNIQDTWQGLVHAGDLIRFGYQGRWYVIVGTSGTSTNIATSPTTPPPATLTAFATGSVITTAPMPTASAPASAPWVIMAIDGSGAVPAASNTGVPYQIMRQPTKSAVPPLQLPEGVVIDLASSGVGTSGINASYLGGKFDVNTIYNTQPTYPNPIITFTPTGGVGFLYSGSNPPQHLSSPLFLLVGRREGMYEAITNEVDVNPGFNVTPGQPTTGQANDSSNPPNLLDMNNMWVAINPQSSLVVTAENANTLAFIQNFLNTNGSESAYQIIAATLPTARTFAQRSTSMGGR